jgi:glycosyltransferase involved in cell wall biosynthesis
MSRLVSVLMPAYNAERWIRQSVASALEQTWSNVEVIVVDDASTDETLAILGQMASPRLKVLRQPNNRGASAARNAALAHAQGDFIQWLDADDLIAPEKIALQMEVFERFEDPRLLLSSSFGEFFVRPERAHFTPSSLWQDLTPIDYLLHKFADNAWLNPGVWLATRSLTESAGPWNEQLSLDDDGEYCSRLVSAASSIRFVPQARVYYRRDNPQSLSRRTTVRACESLMDSLQLCIGHLRALEDSARTREASVRFLQHWVDRSDCFCPDAPARFERARHLAESLGGELQPHRISWKYAPIKALFGWASALRVRRTWANLKLAARVRFDEVTSGNRQEIL